MTLEYAPLSHLFAKLLKYFIIINIPNKINYIEEVRQWINVNLYTKYKLLTVNSLLKQVVWKYDDHFARTNKPKIFAILTLVPFRSIGGLKGRSGMTDRTERMTVIHCSVTCSGTDLHLSPISLFTQHQRLSFTGVPQTISAIIQKRQRRCYEIALEPGSVSSERAFSARQNSAQKSQPLRKTDFYSPQPREQRSLAFN